jgi:rRNA-processing protein FCF1
LYDQIPWKEIVGDNYQIIIVPIVLSELDKHKTNSNKKIANRVKIVLPKIEKEHEDSNSVLNIRLKTPKEETFYNNGLTRAQQDDSLLAAIIEFGEEYGLNDVVLISHDTGPRLKARSLNIIAVNLYEKYLQPNEDSEEEKELKKLRKENVELKNKLPNVAITFNDGEIHTEHEVEPLIEAENDYCKRYLDHIKEKYSPFKIENSLENDPYTNTPILLENLMNSQRSLIGIIQPTKSQKEKYNQELEKFYEEHEKIAKEKYKWDKILSNSVLLNLNISNNGTAPVNDIDIFLEFPNSVKILLYNSFPKFDKPQAPYKPKHSGDFDMSGLGVNLIFNPPAKEYIHVLDKSVIKNTMKCHSIENSDSGSQVIQYKYSDSLKHNLQFSLEPIWVISGTSFSIDYKLLVGNYPKPIEGILNIKIDRKR